MKALAFIVCLLGLINLGACADKHVTNYFLINQIEQLNEFLQQLSDVNNKVSFNRIVLSFIQPSIHTYESGDLSCTGILGYYCDNRDSELSAIKRQLQSTTGKDDFTTLKNAVDTFHEANIEVFLSVGGWDYNCKEDLYCETLKWYNKSSAIVCDKSVNYSFVCEPEGYNQEFDYFPDPSVEDFADQAYANIIKLTTDLGCDGVDLDYEEFWHADYYRRDWKQEDFISEFRNKGSQSEMQSYYDGLNYDDKISQFASSSPDREASARGPFVLPDTVNKVHRIMESLKKHGDGKVKFSFAGPAVGGMPIMVPQYGDSNSKENGGVWWGGNLKGLLYSLVEQYGTSALENWDVGLMTYDFGCRDGIDCGDALPFGCSLSEQVSFYATTFNTYMKGSSLNGNEDLEETSGDFHQVKPKYYNVLGLSTMFGFEIGHPAYPRYDDSWKKLIAVESDITGLMSSIGDQHEGVIVWEMFKATGTDVSSEASTKYIDSQFCQHFNLGSKYDCNADIPNPPSTTSFEKLFLV